ncbi:MAG: DUF6186 family protein [Mycobacteriales bacterium]
MTRGITIAVFAATLLGATFVGRTRRSRVPAAEEVWSLLMGTRTGRVLTVGFWAWTGWHFFCR